jgi:hypothetical protein
MGFRGLSVVLLLAAAWAAAANFYEVLGVNADADEGVIKKAYRKMSLKYHPGPSRTRGSQFSAPLTPIPAPQTKTPAT